jgi:hypothetical protein
MPTENEPINKGQPTIDPGMRVPGMKVPERFAVKCDVHPWMLCYWVVFDHPYFAVSGDGGSFTLSGLPPGQYTLTAWHERLGEQQAQVTVEAGKAAEVNFTFSAQGADAREAAPIREVMLTELAMAARGGAGEAPACEHCRDAGRTAVLRTGR